MPNPDLPPECACCPDDEACDCGDCQACEWVPPVPLPPLPA
ncbi:MAG: hypothetical protein ABR586_04265 [Thermoplasmatota archaeon]